LWKDLLQHKGGDVVESLALFKIALFLVIIIPAPKQSYCQTVNFAVYAEKQEDCKEFAEAAEKLRKEISERWLGYVVADLNSPCILDLKINPNAGPRGNTSFAFQFGGVWNFRMELVGPKESLLDSVLPHEIAHIVLACHFKKPVPRWADEGCATYVECVREQKIHNRMLRRFLIQQRTFAFAHIMTMKEYPRDIMPFYAGSHSLCEYLVKLKGERHFISYISEGMQTQNWEEATKKYYGFEKMKDLGNSWHRWFFQNDYAKLKMVSTPKTTISSK